MRYHLDTIPVWDALHLGGACPLCALRSRTEHTLVDRYLGASVMEPDTRIKVNDKGFCSRHQRMLYQKQNRLGHALMMQSHLDLVKAKITEAFNKAENAGGRSFFKRKAESTADGAAAFEQMDSGCILCESLDDNMRRYVYSFLHLYEHEAAFREAFQASRGLCLKDIPLVLSMAQEQMKADMYQRFVKALREKTLETLDTNKQDIDWFTLKFDYRNADKPWNNSKDALERTVNFLRGWTLGENPWPDDKR